MSVERTFWLLRLRDFIVMLSLVVLLPCGRRLHHKRATFSRFALMKTILNRRSVTGWSTDFYMKTLVCSVSLNSEKNKDMSKLFNLILSSFALNVAC